MRVESLIIDRRCRVFSDEETPPTSATTRRIARAKRTMFKWIWALVRRGKTPQDAAAADERPRKRPKKRDGVAARVQRNVERDGGGGGGDEAARGRHREDSDARDVDARDGGAER